MAPDASSGTVYRDEIASERHWRQIIGMDHMHVRAPHVKATWHVERGTRSGSRKDKSDKTRVVVKEHGDEDHSSWLLSPVE